MRFTPRPGQTEDAKLEMTPMIDVTFLLLIFFMCTLKFRTLEGTLSAFLPDDEGHNPESMEPVESLDLVIEVLDAGTKITPRGEAWQPGDGRWRFAADRELRYRLGPAVCDNFAALDARLARFADQDPPLRVKVDARDGVVQSEAVRVLDALTTHGWSEVSFRGLDERR